MRFEREFEGELPGLRDGPIVKPSLKAYIRHRRFLILLWTVLAGVGLGMGSPLTACLGFGVVTWLLTGTAADRRKGGR